MDRIHQGRSATLAHTFYTDGTATNPTPDSATVVITRQSDGTTLSGLSVTDTGTGTVSVTLTPAQTALLDTLEVTYTATFGGQPQTFTDTVEVAGGFLFNLSDLIAVKPSNLTWTTAQMLQMRTLVEETIEDLCERAFVPRYRQEVVNGDGTASLMLARPDIRTIRSITADGTAYTSGQLATVAFSPSGILTDTGASFTSGFQNVTVGYEHGLSHAPARVRQAALLLARSLLVKGPVDDRALGQATAGGEFSFGLATPGRGGSWVGIPEVDAAIDMYSLRTSIA